MIHLRRALSILSFLCLCSAVCNAQSRDSIDRAVSQVVNDLIRHEKRFLSTSEVFDISIGNKLISVCSKANDGDHNNYRAIVSPKDTTIKPNMTSPDDNCVIWTWVSKTSDTIMTVTQSCYSEGDFETTYSLEDVQIDYFTLMPNRMIDAKGKLFVWKDDQCGESKEVVDRLVKLNRVDFWVPSVIGLYGVINDGEEFVCYDLEALFQGIIKKHHDYGLWGQGFRARLRRGWYNMWHRGAN